MSRDMSTDNILPTGTFEGSQNLDIDRNRKIYTYAMGIDSVDEYTPSSNDLDDPRALGDSKVVEVNSLAPKRVVSAKSIYQTAQQYKDPSLQHANSQPKLSTVSNDSDLSRGSVQTKPKVIVPPLKLPIPPAYVPHRAMSTVDGEQDYLGPAIPSTAPIPAVERTSATKPNDGAYGVIECVVDSVQGCSIM